MARPGAANEYVLDRLFEVAKVEKLLTATPTPGPPRDLSWAYHRLRTAPLKTAVKPLREAALRRFEGRLDRRVASQLLDKEPSVFSAAEPIRTSDLNGDVGVAMLSDIAPDLLVLSGAPLLKPRIFSIPRFGTLNVHWGISPNYRGEQSIFTALRRRDYASIGATLHYLDEGIDTGPVVAQCWPSLAPTDDLASIWAKTAHLVATALTEVVHQLELGPITGKRLSGDGILFRARDRRVWHHLDYEVQRRVRHRGPASTEGFILRCW